jgi:hypothetical protein
MGKRKVVIYSQGRGTRDEETAKDSVMQGEGTPDILNVLYCYLKKS